jgi:hypothetical protein
MKIFRRAAPILGLLSFGLFAAPLAAAPRTINDCEKIQGADAYNQCLASFGPVAHLHGMSSGEAGGDEGGDTGSGASSPAPTPVAHHRHWGGHRSNGRVYMELDAGANTTPDHTHTHRHWTHSHSHRAHRHHH